MNKELPTADQLRELITSSISLNEPNVKHCLAYNTINGSILIDIEDVCHKWAQLNTAPLQARIEELEDVVKVKSEHVKTMIRNGVLWGEEKAELKEENERLREALEKISKDTNKDKSNTVKIKRVTFNGGQPDFILSTQQWHDGGGYTGFLRDNCISISIIDKVIDDEMSEKEFYTLGDWEG